MEKKIVYFSFLESTFEKGGGHIETFEEINEKPDLSYLEITRH